MLRRRSEAAVNFCLGWVQAEHHRPGHWSVAAKAEGMCEQLINSVCLLNDFFLQRHLFRAICNFKDKHSHSSILICGKPATFKVLQGSVI